MKPTDSSQFTEGILQHKGRIGFLLSEDPQQGDVLIEGPTLRLVMPDDRVRVRVTSKPGAPRRSGEIVNVIERARLNVVGVFQRVRGVPVALPDQGDVPVRILDLGGKIAAEGDLVVVRITVWPTLEQGAAGILMEVLGQRGQPGVDLAALVHKHDLPNVFPAEALRDTESFGSEVPEDAYRGRTTFFHLPVFTIDGADAKDFDDAVSLELLPNGGRRLGVHIADVAHYVWESTALDTEAYRRGTSVYLSGTVIPMLPVALSDNLCSLRPQVVRLTLSCVMEIDAQGEVRSHKIVESAIRSTQRFTYEDVEEILKGGTPSGMEAGVAESVRAMGKLARQVRQKRMLRGSLDFDFPEPYVVTDPHGRPLDIRKRERLESHRLIEDFMLLANETVAKHMRDVPFLYRIHETPDPAKIERLKKTLDAIGVSLPRHFNASNPGILQKILASVEGKPVQPLVHIMILRSLKQAVYSPRDSGHYGLASRCYTHFTSPIRRYPDLVVHRLLKERIHGQLTRERQSYWEKQLPVFAAHTSRRERLAVDAEREYLDIQRVRLMADHVGETFTGVVSGITNFGLFIQLNEFFVEGLVHISNLSGDYYIFDEVHMSLRGKRTGKSFHFGQSVSVLLAGVNPEKHQLDLQLIEEKLHKMKAHPEKSHPLKSHIHKPHKHSQSQKHQRHHRRKR